MVALGFKGQPHLHVWVELGLVERVVAMEGVVVELELVESGDGGLAEGSDADELVVAQGELPEFGHPHGPQPLSGGDLVPVYMKEGVPSQIRLTLCRGDKSIMKWSLLSAALAHMY